ncbi:hypothetical protein BGZ54_001620 [Gamsiella multidivaricata]|nr:hypothetical protein BGZ54_001620 [Gamsiella multidivaricata]
MGQFLSVIRPIHSKIPPAAAPTVKFMAGVPWLNFTYSTKSGSTSYTIRVDIDAVDMTGISSELRVANCLYPSADGPKEQYNGTRREYERECNEQGWKLVLLNPTQLDGKRGVLQRAVVCLRNVNAEQKSRRARRQELAVQRSLKSPVQRQVMAIPRLPGSKHVGQPCRPRTGTQASLARSITWQPVQVSTTAQAGQRSFAPSSTPGSALYDNLMSEHNPDIEDREDEDEEEEDVDSEAESSEDESEDGSSSEGGFHSQLSLLSFTGSISTYSLGTGSGSARSRPRITPTPPKHISAPRPLISSSTSSSSAKRSVAGPSSSTEQKERSRRLKRRRYHHSGDQDNEDEESQERDESMEKHGEDTSEKEDEENMEADLTLEQNADEDEDDWWMSRLKNSEYPEDHDFVSMTTEELINALTSGYNSDVEDEDEVGEDEDEALWC